MELKTKLRRRVYAKHTHRDLCPVVLEPIVRQAQGRQLPHTGGDDAEEELGHDQGHRFVVVRSVLPVQSSVEGALGATGSRLAPGQLSTG